MDRRRKAKESGQEEESKESGEEESKLSGQEEKSQIEWTGGGKPKRVDRRRKAKREEAAHCLPLNHILTPSLFSPVMNDENPCTLEITSPSPVCGVECGFIKTYFLKATTIRNFLISFLRYANSFTAL